MWAMATDGEKIEWLRAENERLRQELAEREGGSMIREVRPKGRFDATPEQVKHLIEIAQAGFPMVKWVLRPDQDPVELGRQYVQQFIASMRWLATAARRPEGPHYGYSLDFWIGQAENASRMRGDSISIGPRRFLAAVVASADIAFTAWWEPGAELALGLKVGDDFERCSQAWRRLLAGGIRVPRPVEARPLREAQRSPARIFGGEIW
jgi:hypothetical protein